MRLPSLAILAILGCMAAPSIALAQASPTTSPANSVPSVGDVLNTIDRATAPGANPAKDWSSPVRLAVVFTLLALLPSILVMMTSFTRIVIVLAFIRRALTTQNIPPTVAIVGLAIFLTIFTMAPTLGLINQQAVQPYLANQANFEIACNRGNDLLKDFMIRQTHQSDLEMFLKKAGIENVSSSIDVPTYVAIPAFAISEFRKAFEMGCLLFIPFLLVDLVISGILLSAGMMMLPPSMVSLPFKIILFVLVDGWRLVVETLISSFK